MNARRITLASASAAVALAAACGGAPATDSTEAAAPIPVRVAAPAYRGTEPSILLTGFLGAREEIPLAFKIGGVVERVTAVGGQRVQAGELLAALSLTEIEAQVAAAREGRDKARRDLARVEVLHADSVATLSQLQDARTGLEVAEAQLRAAEFNRQYAEVRAPGPGVVLKRAVDPGQLIGPGAPAFFFRVERSGIVLRAGAADRDAVRIRDGMPATLRFDALPGRTFSGRVTRVGVAAAPTTGAYEVEIELQNPPQPLASGLIGRAELTPASGSPVLTVPTDALLEVDGRTATIFLLGGDGSRVRRVSVQVLWLDNGIAAVAAVPGSPAVVDSASRVIVAGATRLSDSTRVQVVTERAP